MTPEEVMDIDSYKEEEWYKDLVKEARARILKKRMEAIL